MGRTRRKRRHRKNEVNISSFSLDHDLTMIALNKWMRRTGWENESNLRLKHYAKTGRGVFSTRRINCNDRLIEIPLILMITYVTVLKSNLVEAISKLDERDRLKTHDLLALFLVVEKHKADRSKWKCYLDTLPEDLPLLPWLCVLEESETRVAKFWVEVRKRRWNFESSWDRVRNFLDKTTLCCRMNLPQIVTKDDFIWGYVMVNTRAVYVDPDIILKLSGNKINCLVSDEPSMALCPFLDMFNHSQTAKTHASLVYETNWKYVLTTLNHHDLHNEIFISYGGHDNVKLMCEYGFFLPENSMDCVRFTPEFVFSTCGLRISDKQYKFIRQRFWDEILSISLCDLSFYLKAVLYVILNGEREDWNSVIYSENYTVDDMRSMYDVTKKLVARRVVEYKRDENELSLVWHTNCYLENVLNYFRYRVGFVRQILSFVDEKIKEI